MLLIRYLSLATISLLLKDSLAGSAKKARKENATLEIIQKPIWNATTVDKLRRELLLEYEKVVRPEETYARTFVNFSITITHIELDEFKQMITVYSWLNMTWKELRLSWNENDYDGIKKLHFGAHEVWQPDIYLYNSAAGVDFNKYGTTHMVVYSTGQVVWTPPAKLLTFCDINLTYWPFDDQKCEMKFGSWVYYGDVVELKQGQDKPKLDLLVQNSEWNITNTRMKTSIIVYNCCPEPNIDILVTMELKRISPSYKAIVIAPMFVIVVLTLASFWLPPQCGEKLLLNCSSALIVTFLLIYFSQKLPLRGDQTPILVLFYSYSLYIVTFSTISSIVVILLSRIKHTRCLPWCIKWVLNRIVSKTLLLNPYVKETPTIIQNGESEELPNTHEQEFEVHSQKHLITRSHSVLEKSDKVNSTQKEWIHLATIIDRVSFYIYTILFVVIIVYFGVHSTKVDRPSIPESQESQDDDDIWES